VGLAHAARKKKEGKSDLSHPLSSEGRRRSQAKMLLGKGGYETRFLTFAKKGDRKGAFTPYAKKRG